MDTIKVELAVLPEGRVTLVGVRLVVKPAGEPEATKLIMPENPLTLVRLMLEKPEEPALMLRLFGIATIAKSGAVLVEKIAVCTFSVSGGIPFSTVTHVVVPGTLPPEHPIWYPIGVPVVALVTL